jgi:HEAT repeat protein
MSIMGKETAELKLRELIAKMGTLEREQAIEEFDRLDRGAAFLALAQLLDDRDANTRGWAVEMLFRIDADAAVPLVLPRLHDKDAGIRWYVCGFFTQFLDRRAVADLIELVVNDPEPSVRVIACDALASIGDASALPALAHAKEVDEGVDELRCSVRVAASTAIKCILDEW